MKKSVYIETSIPSYLTARPSRDVRAAAWQQITNQWWEEARPDYDLFTSELVIVEASAGNPEAAARRLETLQGIHMCCRWISMPGNLHAYGTPSGG
jgi:hypothetical protein